MSYSCYEIRYICRQCPNIETIEARATDTVGDYLPNGWTLEIGKPLCPSCSAPAVMPKPTEPGWYWVKRAYGADEWVPCCLTNCGRPWIFGDVEEGDDSTVAEWGPKIYPGLVMR